MNENPKLYTTENRPSKEKFQTRGVRREGILLYIDPFTKGVGNLTSFFFFLFPFFLKIFNFFFLILERGNLTLYTKKHELDIDTIGHGI